eukprot:Gb_23744 [translate_table: standard]
MLVKLLQTFRSLGDLLCSVCALYEVAAACGEVVHCFKLQKLLVDQKKLFEDILQGWATLIEPLRCYFRLQIRSKEERRSGELAAAETVTRRREKMRLRKD